jgi:glycosyltransferase involved in cell wall biosynthesis
VFPLSLRGVPLPVGSLLRALQRPDRPLVGFLHEYAYPWRRGGLRGKAWALSQRAALTAVMRACAGAVVTDAERERWLDSRHWLARRPLAVAPVFSNLPAFDGTLAPAGGQIGLFGYSHEGVRVEITLDALRLLQERGLEGRLLLLGAPGRRSAAGERWLAGADARQLAHPPSFSGVLPARELAGQLAGCEVLLCADRPGPTSRKTTLAASLASGRPVVALDGRLTWPELVRAGAAKVVAARPQALADALGELLEDGSGRASLGARGREFAAEHMSVEHSAAVVARLLRELTS